MPTVAVFSGAYCAAEEIVRETAERLGYPVVADDLARLTAEEFGFPADKIARALTGTRAFFDAFTRDRDKSVVYLKATLAKLLAGEDHVVHGPAVQLIPERITHVLRVAVIADLEFRVQRAMRLDGIDAGEAASRVRKSDEALAEWTRGIHGAEPWDTELYDIVIPASGTTVPEAVDLICKSLESAALAPTPESLAAVADFRLATRANLALLEEGIQGCDVEVGGGTARVRVSQPTGPQGKLARTIRALRFDGIERDVRKACLAIEGIDAVEVWPGAAARRPSRTLLVDDEQEYVLTLSERLEVRDIESEVVYDGEQALSFVENEVPDVMVLDLKMPGLQGMDVLRRIKAEHPEVEVIIVTGHGSTEDERLARELGAFDFLSKPVDVNVLAERIRSARAVARGDDETEANGGDAGGAGDDEDGASGDEPPEEAGR